MSRYCVALQMQTDPAALPKLAALFHKTRSVMHPAMTCLGTHPDEDAAHEVIQYYTTALLHRLQSVLKVRNISA